VILKIQERLQEFARRKDQLDAMLLNADSLKKKLTRYAEREGLANKMLA